MTTDYNFDMFDDPRRNKVKKHLCDVYKEIETYLGFKPKCYFAGGCLASIVLDEVPNDYDMWFETPDDFFETVECDVIESDDNVNRSKYATTVILPSGKKIQFVENRMGLPDHLVKTFDFKHTHSYYIPQGKLVCDVDFILRKNLEFAGNFEHPMNTMERILKFSKRGYFVPFETLQQIMLEISKIDKTTLEEMVKRPQHVGSL